MIQTDQTMPYTKKCKLLNVSRSSVYYKSKQIDPDDEELAICLLLDKLHMNHPWMGARSLRDQVNRRAAYTVNRKRIQRLMRKMGIHAVYAKPRPVSQVRNIRFIPTCSVTWTLIVPTTSGQQTSHISPWHKALFT